MCTTCSECVADVYVGVKSHLCNIHTRPCTSAHNTCKVHVTLTAKKCTYIYTYTQKYTHAYAHKNTCACMTPSTRWSTDTKTHNLCTNMHTHTHTHVYKNKIHKYIHTCIYIHISCTHTYTNTHIYTHAYKMYIWTHAKHVWNDGAAASARAAQLDTKKHCPSPCPHHDSAPSRPHPLICTGAEPIHSVHCPRQLPAWPWSPETRSLSCHFGGVYCWK